MRGKAEVRHERDQEPGITPACAGKRHCPRFRPGKTRDHPRVCGEKLGLCLLCIRCLGSPPRMRGKAVATRKEAESIRITPAYAGKSGANRLQAGNAQDHPRVCGEKDCFFNSPLSTEGSPPRMRGKVTLDQIADESGGITPAYAGKRKTIPQKLPGGRDHPRVCGEKSSTSPMKCLKLGSPPRMRGKGTGRAALPGKRRITPAYAGKRHA